MDLVIAILSIIGGFAFLIFGGDWLVLSAISLACRLKISPSVIGLTIIAAGTSIPEMFTSVLAMTKNSSDIAMGNVVGSNIFNILAILGIASIFKPNRVSTVQIRIEIPFMIFCASLLWYFSFDQKLSFIECIFFIFLFIVFMSFSVWLSRKNYSKNLNDQNDEEISKLKNLYHDFFYLLIGFAALFSGAHLVLEGSLTIARQLGLSEKFIGLTIVGIGTGLPELATSIVAAVKGRAGIAIGNVIGSNIFNTLIALGVSGLISPIEVHKHILDFDIPFAWSISVFLIVAYFISKKEYKRPLGIIWVITYFSYLFFQFQNQ